MANAWTPAIESACRRCLRSLFEMRCCLLWSTNWRYKTKRCPIDGLSGDRWTTCGSGWAPPPRLLRPTHPFGNHHLYKYFGFAKRLGKFRKFMQTWEKRLIANWEAIACNILKIKLSFSFFVLLIQEKGQQTNVFRFFLVTQTRAVNVKRVVWRIWRFSLDSIALPISSIRRWRRILPTTRRGFITLGHWKWPRLPAFCHLCLCNRCRSPPRRHYGAHHSYRRRFSHRSKEHTRSDTWTTLLIIIWTFACKRV